MSPTRILTRRIIAERLERLGRSLAAKAANASPLAFKSDVCGSPRETLNHGHLEAVLAARRLEDETVKNGR